MAVKSFSLEIPVEILCCTTPVAKVELGLGLTSIGLTLVPVLEGTLSGDEVLSFRLLVESFKTLDFLGGAEAETQWAKNREKSTIIAKICIKYGHFYSLFGCLDSFAVRKLFSFPADILMGIFD